MSEKENNRSANTPQNFNIPDGYFQKSANNILNKIEWDDEMKPYSKLLELKNKGVFSLPENYFQNSECLLENSNYQNLNAIVKANPFSLPFNYFAEQSIEVTNLLSHSVNDYETQEPLQTILKTNSFEVPTAYFKNAEQKIISQLENKKSAKIIRLSFSRVLIAAAAIVIITFGLWIYKSMDKPVNTDDCGTLACIEKRELLKSKQFENMEADEMYELVNPILLENGLTKKSTNIQPNKNDTNSKKSISDDLLDEI